MNQKVKITRGSYSKITIKISNQSIQILHDGVDLCEYDYIWLTSTWRTRDLGFAVACYLDKCDIPHTKVEFASSKLTDHLILSIQGLSQPKTLYAYRKLASRSLHEIEEFCGYPVVLKPKKGSRGKGTILVKDRKELIQTIDNLEGNNYIFQEYVPNQFDWGINIADGKVVAASKRARQSHDFLNHVYRGAEEIFISPEEVPEKVKSYARKAAKSLRLNWTRADIIFNKMTPEPMILELNRYPGMTVDSPEVEAFAGFLDTRISALL